MRLARVASTGLAVLAAAAVVAGVAHRDQSADRAAAPPVARTATPVHVSLPATPGSYVGVYVPGVPDSYAGVTAFSATTRVSPRVVVYYSAWLEPFKGAFAAAAARHHAVPLVQIDPAKVSLAAVASGRYDSYLRGYADAVRSFRGPVIISFGHEMNATWYQWGNTHTSPRTFVAAWRHIVTVFRASGADNVTWLWAINVIKPSERIASPGPWWPGSSYVTWVGLDGYYSNPALDFRSLFGPTLAVVHDADPRPGADHRDRRGPGREPRGQDPQPVRGGPGVPAARAGLVRRGRHPGLAAGGRRGRGRVPPGHTDPDATTLAGSPRKGSCVQAFQSSMNFWSLGTTASRNIGCRSIAGEYLPAGTVRPRASAMART